MYLIGCSFIFSDFPLLIDPQALKGQMTGHQTAIETLRKTVESLVTSEGDLLSNPDEIQETVGEGAIKAGSRFCTVYIISENLNDFMCPQKSSILKYSLRLKNLVFLQNVHHATCHQVARSLSQQSLS